MAPRKSARATIRRLPHPCKFRADIRHLMLLSSSVFNWVEDHCGAITLWCAARLLCKLWLNDLSICCHSNHLEKSLQLLMDRMDDMSQDIGKYNTYCRNLSKQTQQKQQVRLFPLVCFYHRGRWSRSVKRALQCRFSLSCCLERLTCLITCLRIREEVDWMHTYSWRKCRDFDINCISITASFRNVFVQLGCILSIIDNDYIYAMYKHR